jgi:hypothetical protein
MGNVLSEEKREQIIALGRLEWFESGIHIESHVIHLQMVTSSCS